MLNIVNRDAIDILRNIYENSSMGIRDLAANLGKSTKTVVSAARVFEKLGFISYDYVKFREIGRPKTILNLTRTGKDFLRLSRLLDEQSEGLLESNDLGQYFQFMGVDPLEAIDCLEKYYISGLFALLGQTYDFIPAVKSIYIVVDPSKKDDMNLIACWFSQDYKFIPCFQPIEEPEEIAASSGERNGMYEVKEVNCLEKDQNVKLKVAVIERAIVDCIADYELDPGAAEQAMYILLENRYLDYEKLKEIAEQRGRDTVSRIGFIFNFANEILYGKSSPYRFPETFPSDINYDETNSFTVEVKGAIARIFNLA